MEDIIYVENVSKRFKLYYDRPLTLKERVVRGSKGVYKEFYALTDVSFKVKKGSTVGLIGQNGCGKSTLLKIINRTMFPEKGKVEVRGKVASLIELGAGFHPELSGRENIYTNATVFGITKEEIEKRIPEIIRFSELENFIDNPIRTYSSGMYARLAFSVAIHVDADVLLVDEILGVGDMNFQAKCANKIYEMRKNGTTILLVTHDMGTIDRLCDYAVWLDKGKKIAEGEPKDIQKRYMLFMSGRQEERQKEEDRQPALKEEHSDHNKIMLSEYKLLDSRGIDKRSFQTGEDVKLQIRYKCLTDMRESHLCFGVEIKNEQGVLIYGTNTAREGSRNLNVQPEGMVEVLFENLNLVAGSYFIGVGVKDEAEDATYDYKPELAAFKIYSSVNEVGLVRISHTIYLDGKELEVKHG